MPEAGPYYSYAQLEQLWIQNGGPAAAAPVAAAVALAESGGGAGSTNPTDNGGKQTSWGLWQISNGTHNQPVPNVLDPNVNAGQAVGKWRAAGGTFARDWGTFTSGAYEHYLKSGVAPQSAGVPAGGSITTVSDTSSTSTSSSTDSSGGTCLLTAFGTCLFSRTEARALVGGSLLFVATVVGLAAVFVIARGELGVPAVPPSVVGRIRIGSAQNPAPASTPAPATSEQGSS